MDDMSNSIGPRGPLVENLPARMGEPIHVPAPFMPRYAPPETPDETLSPFAVIGRHWLWISFAAVLAGVAGWYVADNYSSKSWRFTTSLLYNSDSSGAPAAPPRMM